MGRRIQEVAIGVVLIFSLGLSYSQETKVLLSKDLPQLVSSDTVVIRVEVWVQTPNSEIRQRHKIKILEKRNEHIKKLIKKKEDYESVIDTIINDMSVLERENDSLQKIITAQGESVSIDVRNRLLDNNKRLTESKERYFALQNKMLRVRKALRISFLVNAGALLLLLILF